MSFSTEITKTDSEKFALVRIQPRKYLDTLTLVSGTTFTAPLSSDIIIDSVNIKVAGSSDYTTFTYTHANNLLTIVATDDISDPDYYVIVTHNIYATGTKTRYTSGVVTGDSPPDAEWKPILNSYPNCSQTMKDITEGVFTISNTSIDLISNERFFQSFMGTNDSFNDANVDVWMCVNSADNNKIVFSGRVSQITISGIIVNLTVLDSFNKLNSTALFGSDYVYPGSLIATFPNISEDRKAAILVIGHQSPFKLKETASPATVGTPYRQLYHVTNGLKLYQDSPQNYTMSTTTLSFFAGRFLGTALQKMTFGTVTRCYRYVATGPTVFGSTVFDVYYHIQCTNFSGQIGDCLTSGLPTIDSNRLWVCYIGAHTGPDSNTYDFVVTRQEELYISVPSTGLTSNPSLPDNTYDSYCVYRNDITKVTIVNSGGTPSGAHSLYYINGFNNGTSARVVSLGTIGGQTLSALYIDFNMSSIGTYFRKDELNINELYCRFTTNNGLTHADAMKFIVKSAGLTVNETSFTNAETDFNQEVSFSVPFERGDSYPSFLSVAQYIAKSAFGILKINNNREIEYSIIKNPSDLTSIGSRDTTNILSGSFSSVVDYQDCVDTINFLNPDLHNLDAVNSTGPVATTISQKARLLHNVTSNKEYKHCMTSIVNRKSAIAGYFSEPTIQYTYKTSSVDLNSNIGDAVDVTHKSVASTTETVSAVVTEVNNGPGVSTIKLNEIRGVP